MSGFRCFRCFSVIVFFFCFVLVRAVLVKKIKIHRCRRHNQILMEPMEVTEHLLMLLINIPVRNRDNTATPSTDRAINISIRIGSIRKVDTVVTINGVATAVVIAINFFP